MIRLSVVVLILGSCLQARADDLRPLYIELRLCPAEGTTVEVYVRPPPRIDPRNQPSVLVPGDCTVTERKRESTRYLCNEALAGKRLAIVWPLEVVAVPTIIRVVEGDNSQTISLRPGEPGWEMPGADTPQRALLQYIWLGFQHIWVGYDHLLFIACLIWIAGALPRILLAVTGFTLAHSTTLALASLGLLRIPVPWVEAVIALSVVFLAAEIVRKDDTLTTRYPLLVASLFGLLHGLGFAAVLAELALPASDLLLGLLGFNLGVELGQLAFVSVCMLLLAAVHQLAGKLDAGETWIRQGAGYVIGTIAGFWVIERVTSFFL